jgi:hypothetical protein
MAPNIICAWKTPKSLPKKITTSNVESREAIEIIKHPNNLNRDGGLEISENWLPLIHNRRNIGNFGKLSLSFSFHVLLCLLSLYPSLFYNLVYIAAEFNCIYTWIHLLIESSVPLATSPLVQNGNRVCTEPSAETLCTDWKSISLSYPAAIRTFRSILMGILEGSFIGRERTGFPKTVILHLSIRVGDSTIPLPRVPENCDGSFRNCFFICVI